MGERELIGIAVSHRVGGGEEVGQATGRVADLLADGADEAAGILAEYEWPRLYDAERLRGNDVPTAAAVYADDMYVERAFSEETAATVRGMRPWITNEYEHNGLRADGAHILDRLLDLARGRA